ncbi:MAG: sigma-54-dependent Fis family transcriptional regulator [Gemmatimonadota bacterium]|nr:MAG: sigma-54-dependent Fis family transcriptional regulator [Gemmatimonadota bacterium]
MHDEIDALETTAKILVIEDDEVLRRLLIDVLGDQGYEMEATASGEEGLRAMEQDVFDIVLLDINLPGMNGMEVLRLVPARQPEAQVVMMTAFGTVDTAVEAMKQGAFDYINKPFSTDELVLTIRRALEEHDLRRELARLKQRARGVGSEIQIVGKSPAIQRVVDLIARVAPSRATVLVTGDTGTGKELVARAIHAASNRANKAFMPINCAAIPDNLLESELFGHMKGAFTGAIQNKKGLFEEASGGTVFLDEISTMSMALQPKLLRVLQENVIMRVGGRQPIPINIRLIAATNVDLKKRVASGQYREDLYYRLNVFPIEVPSLRDRKEDIPLLSNYFLQKYSELYEIEPPKLPARTLDRMMAYYWPGNVRELENFIERGVVLHASGGSATLGFELPSDAEERDEGAGILDEAQRKRWTFEDLEREYIFRVLESVRWKKTEAAEILGIDRRTLYRKLKRYESEGARSPE